MYGKILGVDMKTIEDVVQRRRGRIMKISIGKS